MGLPIVSRIGANPLWRAGLAIVFILGLAGFAAGVIPQACRSGMVACDGSSALEPLELVDAVPAPEAPKKGEAEELTAGAGQVSSPSSGLQLSSPASGAASPDLTAVNAPVIETAMVERAPAALLANDLVARTFDALDAGLVATPGELSTRTVRTVAVGADGQPVAQDAGGAPVAPLVPEEPAAVAVSEPPPAVLERESSKPVQVAEAVSEADEDVGATAYAPVREGNAVVKGSGANVRSLPKKGGSEVLFALAGGEEVTVVQMSKGWAKIVDTRGRNGWIYGDYLRR